MSLLLNIHTSIIDHPYMSECKWEDGLEETLRNALLAPRLVFFLPDGCRCWCGIKHWRRFHLEKLRGQQSQQDYVYVRPNTHAASSGELHRRPPVAWTKLQRWVHGLHPEADPPRKTKKAMDITGRFLRTEDYTGKVHRRDH